MVVPELDPAAFERPKARDETGFLARQGHQGSSAGQGTDRETVGAAVERPRVRVPPPVIDKTAGFLREGRPLPFLLHGGKAAQGKPVQELARAGGGPLVDRGKLDVGQRLKQEAAFAADLTSWTVPSSWVTRSSRMRTTRPSSACAT